MHRARPRFRRHRRATHARRAAIALFAIALAGGLGSRPARAHGTVPAPNGLAWGQLDGTLLFGTNFGGLWREAPGGPDRFVCETLVQGNPGTLDVWLWLPDGHLVAAAVGPGAPPGVFASSDASGCVFARVAATEAFGVRGLVADPTDGGAFLAAGYVTQPDSGFYTGVVLRGRPGEEPVRLATRAQLTATGLRAAGPNLYVAFAPLPGNPGQSAIAFSGDGGATWEEHPADVAADSSLRPLGLDPSAPAIAWFVETHDDGDVLLRTDDYGQTLTPVLTMAARMTAFVLAPDGVRAWVQTAGRGMARSLDGGKSFTPLAASPHASCLAWGPDARLYACGIPWIDGFAWGVSDDDGDSFAPFGATFGAIAGPLACPDHPEATATCTSELAFLEQYYGFKASAAESPDAEGAEPADADTARAEPAEPGAAHGGCSGGTAPDGLAVLLVLAASTRVNRARRGRATRR